MILDENTTASMLLVVSNVTQRRAKSCPFEVAGGHQWNVHIFLAELAFLKLWPASTGPTCRWLRTMIILQNSVINYILM